MTAAPTFGAPTEPVPPPTRPLAGIRVLDLSRLFPGAFCTQMLADLGADVVKVEAPGFGDGLRFMTPADFKPAHLALNRGKRSITLDLKDPAAADVLRRLVHGADVLVESARPGLMDGLGLGFEALRADNPGLVWCSLTGFGSDGPNATAPGHDLTFLGWSGLLDVLKVGDEPVVPGASLSLPLAGALGAFGIVAALQGRARTGRGARVDANMVDAGMWALTEQITAVANDDPTAGPWASVACRANYRCADGRWITCTASEARSWAALVDALEVPELAGYTMFEDDDVATARLTEVFATRPAAHWLEHPGAAGGIGPVHTPADLVDDPQLTHRDALVHLDGDGPRVLANPLRIDGAKGAEGSAALSAPPDLGQHTDEVLAAAGFSAEEIAALHADGTV